MSRTRGALREHLTLRACEPGDHGALAELMTSTMLLGSPISPVGLEPYVRACLSPYLQGRDSQGRDSQGRGAEAVVVVDATDVVVGYALIGVDPVAVDRAARRTLAPLVLCVVGRWLRGCLPREAARFYRARARDLLGLAQGARDRAGEPHAHLNVAGGLRSGSVALMLRDHIDRRVAHAGHERWWGEVNAVAGERVGALTRLGFEVRGRRTNHTLSRCTGRRVERLTLCRRVPSVAEGAPVAPVESG